MENPLANSNSMTTNLSCFPPKKSFGLYFPPKPAELRSRSDTNLSEDMIGSGLKENPHLTAGIKSGEVYARRQSYTHRPLCIDIEIDPRAPPPQENNTRDAPPPSENPRAPPPYTPSSHRSSSSDPVVMLRSRTTSSLSTIINQPSTSRPLAEIRAKSEHRRSDVDRSRDSTTGGRQYIPVVADSVSGTPMRFSASMDSIDSTSGRYRTTVQSQLQGSERLIQDRSSPNSQTKTFLVRIPVTERQYRAGPGYASSSQVEKNDSANSGTTFALTRSPMSAQVEMRKGSTVPSTVSHKKQLFETGKNENNSPGNNFNRYKTEIQKITGYRKFEGVASRAAMFESSHEYSPPPPGSQTIQSPPSLQPALQEVRARSLATERHTPPRAERPVTLADYQDSTPVKICVSPRSSSVPPGRSSAPSSPTVETVPSFSDLPKPVLSSEHEASSRPANYGTSDSVFEASYPPAHVVQESIHGNRPVRKTSYLSAVNAPRPNCKFALFMLLK